MFCMSVFQSMTIKGEAASEVRSKQIINICITYCRRELKRNFNKVLILVAIVLYNLICWV